MVLAFPDPMLSPKPNPRISFSFRLLLLKGLSCLEDALDPTLDAGELDLFRLNKLLDSDLCSALPVEVSVSLLFLRRRGGEVDEGCAGAESGTLTVVCAALE